MPLQRDDVGSMVGASDPCGCTPPASSRQPIVSALFYPHPASVFFGETQSTRLRDTLYVFAVQGRVFMPDRQNQTQASGSSGGGKQFEPKGADQPRNATARFPDSHPLDHNEPSSRFCNVGRYPRLLALSVCPTWECLHPGARFHDPLSSLCISRIP